MRSFATLAALSIVGTASAQDLIVPAGTTQVLDTTFTGLVEVRHFEIEPGARLVVTGPNALSISAATVRIDGVLDASGSDAPGVGTLNTANQPEPGASGQAGGGDGGAASVLTTTSTPAGLPGLGSFNSSSFFGSGGGGGESSYSALGTDARRGAGGGGGALGRNQPVAPDPLANANIGLVATAGFDGGPAGSGALGSATARGGVAGPSIFVDNDPSNDFWGERVVGTSVVRGEVGRPFPGRGGGAGGDAIDSPTFPSDPFSVSGDEKGAGGGGGGGLVMILARHVSVGPEGRIVANGGHGGGGENVTFFDRVGGGSGGGSGGWIVLEGLTIDFSQAGDDALSALGGRGGEGRNGQHDVAGAGGNGGPGVIQLHTLTGLAGDVLLPQGRTIEDVSTPDAVVLLPILAR